MLNPIVLKLFHTPFDNKGVGQIEAIRDFSKELENPRVKDDVGHSRGEAEEKDRKSCN